MRGFAAESRFTFPRIDCLPFAYEYINGSFITFYYSVTLCVLTQLLSLVQSRSAELSPAWQLSYRDLIVQQSIRARDQHHGAIKYHISVEYFKRCRLLYQKYYFTILHLSIASVICMQLHVNALQ